MQQDKENNRLIRLPQVMKMTGLSKGSIYNLMKRSDFPQNFKIGARASAWKLHEVQQWIDDKCNQSKAVA